MKNASINDNWQFVTIYSKLTLHGNTLKERGLPIYRFCNAPEKGYLLRTAQMARR